MQPRSISHLGQPMPQYRVQRGAIPMVLLFQQGGVNPASVDSDNAVARVPEIRPLRGTSLNNVTLVPSSSPRATRVRLNPYSEPDTFSNAPLVPGGNPFLNMNRDEINAFLESRISCQHVKLDVYMLRVVMWNSRTPQHFYLTNQEVHWLNESGVSVAPPRE